MSPHMHATFPLALLATAALVGASVGAAEPAAAPPAVETVATFEAGASLQAIDRGPDGRLYLTDYAHDRILAVETDGRVTNFVSLPLHPQGILVTTSGFLVTGLVNRPAADPGLSLTERFQGLDGRLLVLDRQGAVIRSIGVGHDTFPNGMTRLDGRRVLIADSLAGKLWAADPDRGTITSWMEDPRLLAAPAFPGANGVKLRGGWVYVTNTTRAKVVRAHLDRQGRPGPAADFADAPGADELVVLADGTIFVAAHSQTLKISPVGVTASAFQGIPGGATLLLAPDDRSLWIATDPPTVNGGKGSPALLRVPLR